MHECVGLLGLLPCPHASAAETGPPVYLLNMPILAKHAYMYAYAHAPNRSASAGRRLERAPSL